MTATLQARKRRRWSSWPSLFALLCSGHPTPHDQGKSWNVLPSYCTKPRTEEWQVVVSCATLNHAIRRKKACIHTVTPEFGVVNKRTEIGQRSTGARENNQHSKVLRDYESDEWLTCSTWLWYFIIEQQLLSEWGSGHWLLFVSPSLSVSYGCNIFFVLFSRELRESELEEEEG